jgi:hypothetical protein
MQAIWFLSEETADEINRSLHYAFPYIVIHAMG